MKRYVSAQWREFSQIIIVIIVLIKEKKDDPHNVVYIYTFTLQYSVQCTDNFKSLVVYYEKALTPTMEVCVLQLVINLFLVSSFFRNIKLWLHLEWDRCSGVYQQSTECVRRKCKSDFATLFLREWVHKCRITKRRWYRTSTATKLWILQNVDYQNVILCWVRSGKDSFWAERYGLLNNNVLSLTIFWVMLG